MIKWIKKERKDHIQNPKRTRRKKTEKDRRRIKNKILMMMPNSKLWVPTPAKRQRNSELNDKY